MLTHRNLVANVVQMQAAEGISADEVVIGIVPFYHIYGLSVLLNLVLHAGATLVLLPRFEVEAFLRAIERYSVTTAFLVPPIVRTLATHPLVDRYDVEQPALHHVGGRTVAGRDGARLRGADGLRDQAGVRADRDEPHDALDAARRDPAQFRRPAGARYGVSRRRRGNEARVAARASWARSGCAARR